jgi:23S rRNA pseudouridine955/2504/2580 synthase
MDDGVNIVTIQVAPEEADQRLDRWFRRRFPGLTQSRLERLLRTGQVRVDGHRVKAGHRLSEGEAVRVPPLGIETTARPDARPPSEDSLWLRSLVLYRDDDVIAINKPSGLAVQGGTGTTRHLDALLDGLRYDCPERPRLVHRLDKDTSGVLLIARSAAAAAALAQAFRDKTTRKTYWALVVGCPEPPEGIVDSVIAKSGSAGRERMQPSSDGRQAITRYRVVATAQGLTWLEMVPITGRTHQLRVHAAQLGTPIVGDRKYGGSAAIPHDGIARRLHLHARSVELRKSTGGTVRVEAPLSPHMKRSFDLLGFRP